MKPVSSYAECSRDDPADCRQCSSPLAGDNGSGFCYQCRMKNDIPLDADVDFEKQCLCGRWHNWEEFADWEDYAYEQLCDCGRQLWRLAPRGVGLAISYRFGTGINAEPVDRSNWLYDCNT